MNIIQEIIASANCKNADYVALMPDETEVCSSAVSYEIHIKTECDKSVLREIVKKNSLFLKENGDLTIIYSSLSQQIENPKWC